VHTRFLQVEGEKMSKSKGNFFTVRQLIGPEADGGRGIDPLALRYALISGKYREPFNFTMKHLRDTAKVVRRYQEARTAALEAASDSASNGEDRLGPRLDATYDATLEAMVDDLNTPIALAKALEGVKLIQGFGPLDATSARSAVRWFERINALLGFVFPEDAGDGAAAPGAESDPLAERVEALLAERTAARGRRDFARADAIRAELDDLGVEVMDRPDGTSWRRKI
jgi:cysteinyl-tRNA synthetase